jgi:hypothetical protein
MASHQTVAPDAQEAPGIYLGRRCRVGEGREEHFLRLVSQSPISRRKGDVQQPFGLVCTPGLRLVRHPFRRPSEVERSPGSAVDAHSVGRARPDFGQARRQPFLRAQPNHRLFRASRSDFSRERGPYAQRHLCRDAHLRGIPSFSRILHPQSRVINHPRLGPVASALRLGRHEPQPCSAPRSLVPHAV